MAENTVMNSVVLSFFSRPGCCLCERALRVVQSLQTEFDFRIEIIDISESDDLERRYGIHIPVGRLGEREVFRYEVDSELLRRLLRESCQS